jgi:hypothetical protein
MTHESRPTNDRRSARRPGPDYGAGEDQFAAAMAG